ncbi:MAG: hypothetical protein M3156_00300 [Thermoproteota archaeon]|nr:hypothetical protein [Thermoproteota archaeon]
MPGGLAKTWLSITIDNQSALNWQFSKKLKLVGEVMREDILEANSDD